MSVDLVGRGLFGGIERGSLGVAVVVAVEGVESFVGRLGRGSGIERVVVVGFGRDRERMRRMGGSSLEVGVGSFAVGLGIAIAVVVVDLDIGIEGPVGSVVVAGLDLVVARVVRSRPRFVEAVDVAAAANSDSVPADSDQVRIQVVVPEPVRDDQRQVHKRYEHNT